MRSVLQNFAPWSQLADNQPKVPALIVSTQPSPQLRRHSLSTSLHQWMTLETSFRIFKCPQRFTSRTWKSNWWNKELRGSSFSTTSCKCFILFTVLTSNENRAARYDGGNWRDSCFRHNYDGLRIRCGRWLGRRIQERLRFCRPSVTNSNGNNVKDMV